MKNGGIKGHTGILAKLVELKKWLTDHGAEEATGVLRHTGFTVETFDRLDASGRTPLFEAALNDDVAKARKLLKAGARAFVVDKDGITPLHVCAENGSSKVAKLLIEWRAKVDARDKVGMTPLTKCAACPKYTQGHVEMVRDLLEGALKEHVEIEAHDNRGASALVWAAKYTKVEMCKVLVEHGADIESEQRQHLTPLLQAIGEGVVVKADDKSPLPKSGCRAMTKWLLDRNANIRAVDVKGAGALHLAVGHNNAETKEGIGNVLDLLARLPDLINSKTEKDETPLMFAARSGYLTLVKTLLDHGAIIDAETTDGMTALHFAALNGDWAIAEELLSRKPFDWSKARGWTPLHYAAWQGHVEFVQKLCARVPALLKMPLKTAMMGERGPFTPLELADYGCALSQAEWLEVKLVLEPKCLSDRVRMAKCAKDESKLINELQGEVAEQLGISDALKSKKCNDADKKRLKDGVNERLKQVWMPRRQAMHKALCELGFK